MTALRALAKAGNASPSTARQATLVACVLLCLVALAPVASAQLSAARMTGTGAYVSAVGATVAFRPGAGFSLHVASASGHAVLVDESVPNAVQFPGTNDPFVSYSGQREERPFTADLASIDASAPSEGDAVALVVPLGGSQPVARATAGADFSVDSTPAKVIERSHARSQQVIGQSPFQYYEYAVPDSLEWTTKGSSTLRVDGAFEVYLWGIPFDVQDANGEAHVVTGYSSEPSEATRGATSDEHYRYAKLQVENGSVDVSADAATLSIFAAALDAQASQVTFQSTEGTAPVEGGSLSADGGPVTVSGGSYRLAYKPQGIGIDVSQPPSTASGPYMQFTPTPWQQRPWVQGMLGATVLALGLVGTVYAYPTVSGARHLRYMEGLTGKPRARGWHKSRAEGYALMAASAEDAGHMRRATLWMRLASAFDPHDPTKRLDLGIFLAARGRYAAALRHFGAAHQGLLEEEDMDNVAHNAYEAARAAAMVRDGTQALDWLRIALQADPQLAAQVGLDAAFASLRDSDDYAALTRE